MSEAKRFPRLAMKLQGTNGIQEGEQRNLAIEVEEKGVYVLPNSQQRVIPGIASTDSKDRVDEVISPKGWVLKNFNKNSVLLWGHDHDKHIGKVRNIKKEQHRLTFEGVETAMNKTEEAGDPFAKFIFDKYLIKELRMFSVGFIPLKWTFYNAADEEVDWWYDADYLVYDKAELLEISCVTIGCNQDALTLSMAKAFGVEVKKDTAAPFEPSVIEPNHDALISLFINQQLKQVLDLVNAGTISEPQVEVLTRGLIEYGKAIGYEEKTNPGDDEASQKLKGENAELKGRIKEVSAYTQILVAEKAQLSVDLKAVAALNVQNQRMLLAFAANRKG